MEITLTTIILMGAICAVLGFLASSLLSTLRDDDAAPGEDPVPPGGQKGRYTPIARLWRSQSQGKLIVEVDGKSLVGAAALDEAQREKLEFAARDLRAWLGMGPAAAKSAPAAPPASEAEPASQLDRAAPVSGGSSPWPPDELEPDPGQNLRQAVAQPARFKASARPAAQKVDPTRPVEDPKAPPGSKSIVMQIEDILQDMIAGTALDGRDIHVSEDPVRGVIVMVGPDQYEGIEAVPDHEVKAAIQAAVAAWEQSQ